MKVVIDKEIKLEDIDIETLYNLAEFSVNMKDDTVLPQKITLEAGEMWKVLDIIDAYITGIISLDMYDSGRFTLVIKE